MWWPESDDNFYSDEDDYICKNIHFILYVILFMMNPYWIKGLTTLGYVL